MYWRVNAKNNNYDMIWWVKQYKGAVWRCEGFINNDYYYSVVYDIFGELVWRVFDQKNNIVTYQPHTMTKAV